MVIPQTLLSAAQALATLPAMAILYRRLCSLPRKRWQTYRYSGDAAHYTYRRASAGDPTTAEAAKPPPRKYNLIVVRDPSITHWSRIPATCLQQAQSPVCGGDPGTCKRRTDCKCLDATILVQGAPSATIPSRLAGNNAARSLRRPHCGAGLSNRRTPTCSASQRGTASVHFCVHYAAKV